MKRLLCLALTLACALASAAAWAEPAFNEPGAFPIAKEPVTLSVAAPDNATIEDYDTNAMTLLLEEKSGMDLAFVVYPSVDYATKINVMIMGGDTIPDIVLGSFGDSLVYTWALEGAIAPLTAYYEDPSVSYWLHEAVERCGTNFFPQVISPDGEIYGIPMLNQSYGNEYSAKYMIYEPWLEALGMEVPETTEALYQVLKAVSTTDLNGNGIQDEIAFAGSGTGGGSNWLDYLMNAFVYADVGSNYMKVDEGKLSFSYTDPAWKEGLHYVRRLFEEGIMPLETLTQDENQWRAMLNTQEDTVFSFVFTSASQVNTSFVERRGNYAAILPVAGPTGTRYAKYNPSTAGIRMVVSADCAHPEAAFRVGDLLCSELFSIIQRWGEEGVDWDYFDVVQDKAQYAPFLPGWEIVMIIYDEAGFWSSGTIQNRSWKQTGPFIRQYAIANGRALDPASVTKFDLEGAKAAVLYQESGMAPAEVIPKLIYDDAENEIVSPILATLKSYVQEATANFLAGNVDIDAGWDAFQAELEAIGTQTVLPIAQGAYDRMYK